MENNNNENPDEVIQRTQRGLQRLRETQMQLVQDIQERYNVLGQAVHQLRSYFTTSGSSSGSDASDGNSSCDTSFVKIKDRKSTCTHTSERPLSADAVAFLNDRQYGFRPRSYQRSRHQQFLNKELPDFVSQHLPGVLTEKELKLGSINKVFAAKWLNNSQVVMGTKCNKLMVMDVRDNTTFSIPTLKSSPESSPAECPCGIHAISINPSRTLLATGAQNTNDLAVYDLPTFDALCVGQNAHKDWIFDIEFIDDEHIVTGSRDSTVAVWRVHPSRSSLPPTRASLSAHPVIKPLTVQTCKSAHRVRALALSQDKRLMGVLSMDAKFHFWDLERFRQIESIDLPWRRENVCVASSDTHSCFAVGSEAYVTLLDHRATGAGGRAKCISLNIPAKHRTDNEGMNSVYSWPSKGIRSLSFNQSMVTIGTGDGRLIFYDMRAKKFLHQMGGGHCELAVGVGWLRNDSNYRDHFMHGNYPNAIYTHAYDDSQTRIFAAGGPLPAGLYGNYSGIFH